MLTKLSIVIPAFNEQHTIVEVLRRVLDISLSDIIKEVIVIDDGSTDGTHGLLANIHSLVGSPDKSAEVKILRQDKNLGKGAALRRGFSVATGDIILVQDADLEYDPVDYPKLLEPIMSGRADVVYGSRFVGGEAHRALYFWHYLGNKLLTVCSNIFSNLNLTDMECCYKVFRRDVLELLTLKENRFGFEPEVTAKVAKLNCRVYEVGVSYSGRTYQEGKKIGWRDGVAALWCILKYNLLK